MVLVVAMIQEQVVRIESRRSKTFVGVCVATVLFSIPALALRNPDLSGDDNGAAVVYSFGEMGGDVATDSSGAGVPLHLRMSVAGNLASDAVIRTNALIQSGYLLVNPKPNGAPQDPDSGYQGAQVQRTFLVSEDSAAKLSQCTTGFTIQAFVRPWFPRQGNEQGNLIVGLSNSEGKTSVNVPNFGLYQIGESGTEAALLRVRTGDGNGGRGVGRDLRSKEGAFLSVREGEKPGQVTELIATQEPNGVLTLYINRIPRSTLTPVQPVFLPTAKLVIGNELVPLSRNNDGTTNVSNQQNWSGEIYHVAIYCRGFTRAEILGASVLDNKVKHEPVAAQLRASVSGSRIDARRMVERLTGVLVPIDHPLLTKVEQRILAGDRVGAAKIVTGDNASKEPGHPDFLNVMVKQLAVKMSNREETIRAPLNDMAASFIGIARDERSAKELLTEDFFYMADPRKAQVRSDVYNDLLLSNNHYEDLEKDGWDLGKVLVRVPSPDLPAGFPTGQQIVSNGTGGFEPSPDPAGVITSRAFMAAHAIAGTNRRLVEFAFKEFLCVPMIEMADTSASSARIGRDIDRLPGGDSTKFETSCKGCHTVMDGFRGAFARYDFGAVQTNGKTLNIVRHTQVNKKGESFGFSNEAVDKWSVVRKMNHNENTFPNGFEITDESFVNNAVGANNRNLFGWQGANARGGVGVNQFGRMIADSKRFSQCMAKRVYETVCTPGSKSDSRVTPLIDGFANKFEASGYKLRSLFQEVAASPACAANMGR